MLKGLIPLIGAIAQLGERLPCTQEAVGSIPSGSTIILQSVIETKISGYLKKLIVASPSYFKQGIFTDLTVKHPFS